MVCTRMSAVVEYFFVWVGWEIALGARGRHMAAVRWDWLMA